MARFMAALAVVLVVAIGVLLGSESDHADDSPFPARAVAATASVALEGEAMRMTDHADDGVVSDDADASGGRMLWMWDDTTATGSVDLTEPARQVVVRLRGDQCDGAPEFTLAVDGHELRSDEVPNRAYEEFAAAADVAAGAHQVTVEFRGDLRTGADCDRNLILDRVEFRETPPAPGPTPTPTPSPGPADGRVVFQSRFQDGSWGGYDLWQQQGGGTRGLTRDDQLGETVAWLGIPGGSGTQRSQLQTPDLWRKGTGYWTGFAFRVDAGHPRPGNWSKIESIYGPPYSGSENRMIGDARSVPGGIQGNRLEPGPQWQVNTEPGRWYDVVAWHKLASATGRADGQEIVYVATGPDGYRQVYRNMAVSNVPSSMSQGPYDQRLVFYAGGGAYPSGSSPRHYFARHKVATTAAAANPAVYNEPAPE